MLGSNYMCCLHANIHLYEYDKQVKEVDCYTVTIQELESVTAKFSFSSMLRGNYCSKFFYAFIRSFFVFLEVLMISCKKTLQCILVNLLECSSYCLL